MNDIVVYPEEVMEFEHFRCIPPCLFYSIFCLRSRKSSSMGELISVIFARVILNVLVSFVRINLHYFAIDAHISPIMLGFTLFVF